jgi:hypothetical protein
MVRVALFRLPISLLLLLLLLIVAAPTTKATVVRVAHRKPSTTLDLQPARDLLAQEPPPAPRAICHHESLQLRKAGDRRPAVFSSTPLHSKVLDLSVRKQTQRIIVIEVVVLTAPSLCLTHPHGPSLAWRPNGPHGPSGSLYPPFS